MAHARIALVFACLMACCFTPQTAAQQPGNPSSNDPMEAATNALLGLICGEMRQALSAKDKRAGPVILLLDFYYTRHAGLPDYTTEWARTVSQGVGGTCAIDVNATRTVLDVIAQMHREYGGATKP